MTNKVSTTEATDYAKEVEERRATKEANVTSAAHERFKKRQFKAADGFLTGDR